MADISKIKLPNEAEPRLVKDTEARNIANSKAADAVFIPADPTAQPAVEAKRGLVPAPPSTPGSTKFLREDATWAVPAGVTDYTQLDSKPQINSVTLTGNLSAADLGLQATIGTGTELSSDLVDDTNHTNKFVTATDITNWNDKLDGITVNDGTEDVLVADTKLVAGSNVTITPDAANNTVTIAGAYSAFHGSGTGHAAGLVPDPGATQGTVNFLREDGTWATPAGKNYTEGTGIDISNADVISNTGVTSVTESDASTGTNGTILVSTAGATAVEVAVKGLNNAAYKGVDTAISAQSTNANIPTSDVVYSFVQSEISGMTGPMKFKGAAIITADSTDTTKCSIAVTDPASSADIKVGFTYKITNIASSPAYTGTLKVGDVLIADTNDPTVTSAWVENTDWTVVPSGDDETYPKFTYVTEDNVKYIGIDYGNII